MLRDLLTLLPDFETWPCDEINPIWRHGNFSHPTDEFDPDLATPAVTTWLRRTFERQRVRTGATRMVEKTCANSLRVGFVDRVFPGATFVMIVRDGRDAAASALKRWRAPVEWSYTLRKARFVPLSDLPRYAARFAANRLRGSGVADRRVASWGPRFDGMDRLLRESTLDEVCAEQWQQCVTAAVRDLDRLPADRTLRVRYEDLVRDPSETLTDVFEFIGAPDASAQAARAAANVRSGSVGRWTTDLQADQIARIEARIGPTLAQQGYA